MIIDALKEHGGNRTQTAASSRMGTHEVMAKNEKIRLVEIGGDGCRAKITDTRPGRFCRTSI